MLRVILLFSLMLTPLSVFSKSISDGFILVQVKEYKLNNVQRTIDSSKIIASWVVRKTEEFQFPFMCSTILAGYLDTEKTKSQNIARLNKMLNESEGVTKLFADNESAISTFRLSRKRTEQKIKNIDQFSYSVNCLEILPNSDLKKYFSFGDE